MPKQISEPNQKVQEMLDRVRSRYGKSPDRKKRFPAFLLVINVLLIGVVLYFPYNADPSRGPGAGVIRFDDVEYRVSVSKDAASGNYNVTMIMGHLKDGEKKIAYSRGIADVAVLYRDVPLHAGLLGRGSGELAISRDRPASFLEILGAADIKRALEENFSDVDLRPRGFIFKQRPRVPLKLLVTLKHDRAIATELSFSFEVR